MIGHALRDAAKLFWLELQIEAGEKLEAAIVDEIKDAVCHSPKDADQILDEMVQRVMPSSRAARSASAARASLCPEPPPAPHSREHTPEPGDELA